MTEPGEIDEPVEDQTDQVLAALALVLAEAAASQSSDDDNPVAWLPVISSTGGLVLTQFLLRTSNSFVAAFPAEARMQPQAVRPAVDRAVAEAVSRATDVLSESSAGWATLPAGERASQVRTDAGLASRVMVLGAREPLRHELAATMGALYKVWRTRGDTRVRTTHGGLEGNRVPLSQPFTTHLSNELMYPHDPKAPLGETAGCRCRLSYLVKEKP